MGKTGILGVVAKSGGIKFNNSDEWLNPTPEAKTDFLNRLDELKRLVTKEVVVTFNEDNKVVSIHPTNNATVKSAVVSSDKKAEDKGIDRERIIVRQNAMSHSSALIKVFGDLGLLKNLGVKEIEEVYFELSAKCENWVFR